MDLIIKSFFISSLRLYDHSLPKNGYKISETILCQISNCNLKINFNGVYQKVRNIYYIYTQKCNSLIEIVNMTFISLVVCYFKSLFFFRGNYLFEKHMMIFFKPPKVELPFS